MQVRHPDPQIRRDTVLAMQRMQRIAVWGVLQNISIRLAMLWDNRWLLWYDQLHISQDESIQKPAHQDGLNFMRTEAQS